MVLVEPLKLDGLMKAPPGYEWYVEQLLALGTTRLREKPDSYFDGRLDGCCTVDEVQAVAKEIWREIALEVMRELSVSDKTALN